MSDGHPADPAAAVPGAEPPPMRGTEPDADAADRASGGPPSAPRRRPVGDGDTGSDTAGPVLRLPPWVWQVGIAGWSFVGITVVLLIVVHALAAVSEVTLPLVLAAMLAVGVKPWADALRRRRSAPGLAARGVSLGLVVAAATVAVATVTRRSPRPWPPGAGRRPR